MKCGEFFEKVAQKSFFEQVLNRTGFEVKVGEILKN
jgi:hypothetical protein